MIGFNNNLINENSFISEGGSLVYTNCIYIVSSKLHQGNKVQDAASIAGLYSSITGSSVGRGGGAGGGRGFSGGSGGTNGSGGSEGGRGANTTGLANTGGGGGGRSRDSGPSCCTTGGGAAGGSGVVIVRYPNTLTITVGGGLTSSTTTVGTDKVTTFTAGTGTVSFA